MTKPKCEGELTASRDPEDRGSFGRRRDSETRAHPGADILDEELLVDCEPARVEGRRVFVEPRHFLCQSVYSDDHRGGYVRRFEGRAPQSNPLAVAGEHHPFGRFRRHVDGDPAAAVVIESIGHELSCHRAGPRCLRRGIRTACFGGWFPTWG